MAERTVHYRSVDPIQNLKLRVVLTCRSGTNTDQPKEVPAGEAGAEAGGAAEKGGSPRRSTILGRFGLWKGKENAGDGGGKAAGKEAGEGEESGADAEGEGAEGGEAGEMEGEGEQEPGSDAAVEAKAKAKARKHEDSWSAVVGWQEKVFSGQEVFHAMDEHPHDALLSPRAVRAAKASPEKTRAMRSLANASLQASYRQTITRQTRRSVDGSQDSRIFTYINADEFTERTETDRTVSTSDKEHLNPLAMALYSRPRGSNQVLKYQTMFVMADCGEKEGGQRMEKVLVAIKAYPDGSFDMRPGLNRRDKDGNLLDDPYEFEDDNGAQWYYTVENAAKTDATLEEKRAEELTKWHNERARVLRKALVNQMFEQAPGPSPDALRFVLMAEIVAAKDFKQDQLWVEYDIRYDPEIWAVKPEPSEPGHLQGCTHVSTCAKYPGEPGRGVLPHYVAHFSHPIEFEFFAQGSPKPSQWPSMCFQVNTYDNWDRYTVQGYTHLPLHAISRGGCAVHRLTTWKPLGTVVDKLNSFFIGGSAELKDITYSGVPQSFNGKFLSRFGFKAETSGVLKIRTSAILQQRRPPQESAHTKAETKRSMAQASMAARDATRKREMLTLARVVERARRRLEAARGGPVVVRGEAMEAMAEPPTLVKDTEPEEWEAEEGGLAGFSVKVQGRQPLRYQWFKGQKALRGDSGAVRQLLLKDVQMVDAGSYHCVVSNADGKVVSRNAKLKVVPALGFVEQPDDYLECVEGSTAKLAVEAKGKPPLEYRWFKDQKELNFDDTCQSPELVISDTGPSDSGYYFCVVSNDGGSEQSENCQLFVTADRQPKKPTEKKPAPSAESETDSEDDGESAEGEEEGEDASEKKAAGKPMGKETGRGVKAPALKPVSRSRGDRAGDPDNRKSDAAVAFDDVDDVPALDAEKAASERGSVGSRVTNSDSDGEGGGEAAVAVAEAAPTITDHPQHAAVREGEAVEFRVGASGGGELRYQWLRDGEALPGEAEATLAFMRVGPEQAGEYCCEVSRGDGRGGVARSDAARLQVNRLPATDDIQELDDVEEIEA
eukprot:jgi/Tetstr1/453799/TSEL_040751.t1